MICAQCESEIQDSATFCPQCGAQQERSEAGSENSSPERRPSVKGRVLDYDWKTNTGMISGEDGFRYQFGSSDWNSEQTPRVGATVDFVANDDKAVEVYLVTTRTASAIGGTDSKRLIAGILGILIGVWGIHKFVLGYNKEGVIMLIGGTVGWILFVPGFAVFVVGVIEGVIYLTKTEEEFNKVYVEGNRPWF